MIEKLDIISVDALVNSGVDEPVYAGFRSIAEKLNGGFDKGIHLITGKPGVGKTAFVLQIAQENLQRRILYLNTEMGTNAVVQRIVSRNAEIRLSDIVNRKVEQPKLQTALDTTLTKIQNFSLVNGLTGFISVQYLEDNAKILVGETKTPLLLIIDSFNSWVKTAAQHFPNETAEQIGQKLLLQLSEMVDRLGATVLITIPDTETVLMKYLDATANTVVHINNEKGGRSDVNGRVVLRFTVTKSRYSASNQSVMAYFNGDLQSFSDYTIDNEKTTR